MKTIFVLMTLLSLTSCIVTDPINGPIHRDIDTCNRSLIRPTIAACDWGYYSNGQFVEIDIASEISDKEKIIRDLFANEYQERFSLSKANAQKLSKAIMDFNSLQERTEDDILDFAVRVYGVNTSELVEAISYAQLGENET